MPYYVYRVIEAGLVRRLENMGERVKYGDAAALARQLRTQGDQATGTIRLIFADNALRAEELLSATRPSEPRTGDDD